MRRTVAVCALAVLTALLSRETSAHAQRLESVESLAVVDAQGRKVGLVNVPEGSNYLDVSYAYVFFTVGERVVRLGFTRDEFWGRRALSFELPDCSGTPYVNTGPSNALAIDVAIGPPGKTLYLPDPSAAPQRVAVRSYVDGGCQNFDFEANENVVAVRSLDLSGQFAPPFRLANTSSPVRAQCCGDCDGNGEVTIDEAVRGIDRAVTGCPSN